MIVLFFCSLFGVGCTFNSYVGLGERAEVERERQHTHRETRKRKGLAEKRDRGVSKKVGGKQRQRRKCFFFLRGFVTTRLSSHKNTSAGSTRVLN